MHLIFHQAFSIIGYDYEQAKNIVLLIMKQNPVVTANLLSDWVIMIQIIYVNNTRLI